MIAAIDLRGVRKAFGEHQVLDGIDLLVEAGTIFALLGPNGAGKTTLINILSTLVSTDSGSAVVGGADVVSDPESVRGLIGVTGQSAAVDPVLTGDENLRMMGRLLGLSRREAGVRSRQILDQLGLSDAARRRAGVYSGGMRRRLDLALSLIVTSPIIFLDEPTTGLDVRSRRELWDIIRSLRTAGTTVFLTTQYLEEADELADRIGMLSGGRIIATGTPADLKAQTGVQMVELRGDSDVLLREVPTDGSLRGLRLAIDDLDAEFDDGEVTIRRPSLDDVFLTLTGPADTHTGAGAPRTERP
ncbi:ABC-2 type transport system ATP-binding protein [Mycetocola sp. CAN_C7]|uniref:ATP-binding cassette domain-containing protein n=1 Tax=Mycetocola sp. CAN_C7 TaxID=2787724 RepID=UPI0018CB555D